MFIQTNYMFTCNDAVSVKRRMSSLPQFTATVKARYNVSVEWLYGQSKDDKDTDAFTAWSSYVAAALQNAESAGLPPPTSVLHLDIEYDAVAEEGPDDAERVLGMAAQLAQLLDAAGLKNPPRISWDVSQASISELASCPVTGDEMTVISCFLQIVDRISVLAYRSFAIRDVTGKQCDGVVVKVAPFLELVSSMNAELAGARLALEAAGQLVPRKLLKRSVTIGVETACDADPNPTVVQKISFCGQYQASHTKDPLGYMYATLRQVAGYLADTKAAVAKNPCASKALPANKDLWHLGALDTPAFMIHPWAGFDYLAAATNPVPLCPIQELAPGDC
jgi:hypothetical protein